MKLKCYHSELVVGLLFPSGLPLPQLPPFLRVRSLNEHAVHSIAADHTFNSSTIEDTLFSQECDVLRPVKAVAPVQRDEAGTTTTLSLIEAPHPVTVSRL